RVGGHQAVVGDVPVGDEHLRAVDHVVVTVTLRRGADRGGVRPGVRLREAEGAELPTLDRRHEVAPLLLLGPEAEDGDAAEPDVRQQRGREAAVDARELLDEQAAHHHVAATAAVLLRVADAEVAEAAELTEEVHREALARLQLLDPRRELPLGDAPDRAPDALLLLAQTKAQHGDPPRARDSSLAPPAGARRVAI